MLIEQADQAGRENATAKLVIESVSKWYKTSRATVHALDSIDLAVAEGEFICLVGPSGCGKSTLLDIVAGLTRRTTAAYSLTISRSRGRAGIAW